MLVLLAWYSSCVAFVVVSYRLGRSSRPIKRIDELSNDKAGLQRLLLVLTGVGAVGVAYSVYQASQETDVLAAISGGTANELSQALGEGAGLATFRYATAVAAPLSFLLWQRKIAGPTLAIINLLLLVANSIFASRLALLLAAAVFLFGYVGFFPDSRVRFKALVAGGLVAFALLTFLNYSRNANFYAAAGVTNPVESNIYQILTYAGTPYQASIGVADLLAHGRYYTPRPAETGLLAIVPTFLQDKSQNDATSVSTKSPPAGSQRYSSAVSVAKNLTTNSSFADTVSAHGASALLWILVSLLAVGYLFGHFSNYSCPGSLVAGVLGYGLLETWRIYLFNQGIIIFLILLLTICALAVGGSNRSHEGR